MNSTIALPELAVQVARLAGTDADSAGRFILALFGAAEAALAAGESVTLKGIGSFRRSADNSSIEFTPAAELAEAVNAPFALFAPMELPDDAPADIFAPDVDKNADDEAVAPSVEEQEEKESVETVQAEEPAPEEEAEEEATADAVVEEEPEETQANTDASESCESEDDDEAEEEIEPEVIYVERRSAWPWIAAILCLVVGFAGGYCYGTHCGAPAPVAESDNTTTAAAAPAAPAIATPCDTAQADTTASIAAAAPADSIAAPEAKEVKKEPVYDTVTSTRFLTTIARSHYGRKDFWVFIYEANADILRHPNRIRPGTRVVVPDLGEHAAADPEVRAKAHRLANEIYSRYDM